VTAKNWLLLSVFVAWYLDNDELLLSVGSSFLPPQDASVSEVSSMQATLQWTRPSSTSQQLSTSTNRLLGFSGSPLDFLCQLHFTLCHHTYCVFFILHFYTYSRLRDAWLGLSA